MFILLFKIAINGEKKQYTCNNNNIEKKSEALVKISPPHLCPGSVALLKPVSTWKSCSDGLDRGFIVVQISSVIARSHESIIAVFP